jgi:hypothetical protein
MFSCYKDLGGMHCCYLFKCRASNNLHCLQNGIMPICCL